MIPTKSIKAFLARKRDDFRTWKDMTATEADRRVDQLPVMHQIWDSLRLHQKICVLIGIKCRRFFYILDMGMGKTLLSLVLIWYFRRVGIIKKKVLVLVPTNIARFEWTDEIEKHMPKMQALILDGSSNDKWEDVETTKLPIVVCTHAGLFNMVCEKKKKKPKSRKLNLVPSKKLVKAFGSFFDGLIIDESAEVGGHDKIPYRIAKKIAESYPIMFELTGTPFGRDPTPIWSQMFLVDDGWSLGETLGLFRAAFFRTERDYWAMFKHTFLKRKSALLHRFLAHRSIRYMAKEGDLPERVPIRKNVVLDDDADAYYERAKEMMKSAGGDFRMIQQAFLRQRQISSGFIGFKDDETGERAEVEFDINRKLEALVAVIKEIGDSHKFVIFHDFIYSGGVISRELDKMKIKHSRVWGGTKDSREELRRFKEDEDTRGFVVNSAAGATSLNLQMARYVIFYECPVDPKKRWQAIRRVQRQGSEFETVFVVDLVCLDTQDERILAFNKQGADLFAAIVDGRAKAH